MADTTAPLFQRAKTTANGQKIVLTYSEALSNTSAAKEAFVVKVDGQALAVTNVAVVGNTLELSLVAAVQRGQAVKVSYTDPSAANNPNAVQDTAGNDAINLTNRTVTNISTVDIAPPTLATNNTPLDIAADIQLSFAEPVTKGTAGSVRLYKADGTLVEQFDIATSRQLTVSGNTLTINPTWALEGSAGFYLQVDAGALTVGGDSYAGIRNRALAFQTDTETRNAVGAAAMSDNFPGTSSEAIGEHRALYIRVNYADEVVAPNTEERVRADMADFERFYAESSFARISVSTTMTPVVTIPQTLAWLNAFDRTENGLGVLHESARAEALKMGFDPSQYDVVVVRVDDGLRSGSSWGGGDSVWISWDGASVIAHEAGHALGRGHSNFLEYDGSVEEYGNSYDNMGGGDPFAAHFNTIHKSGLGWIANDELYINPENGLYRLYAYDMPNYQVGRHYGIQIDTESGKYWLEYHPSVGGRFENAAIVLRSYDAARDANQNVLIDTTPSAENVKSDAGIDVGRTYKIDDTYFTVVARGDGYLDVNVQKGTFAQNTAPTAAFTASASRVQSGGQVTFNANAADSNGDALAYFWSFSDGVVGSGATFSRFFSQNSATNVTATLTVSDMRGGEVSHSTTLAAGASSTGSPVTVGSVGAASNTKPLVSLVASDAFGAEGGDQAAFTVSRVGGAVDTALTVKLAYAGTAVRNTDFSALPSDVVIAAGQRTATVVVNVLDDAVREAIETLSATVRSNAAYSISAQNNAATLRLSDNDAPVVRIEALDASANESGRDSGTLLITRTGSTTDALTVYYALSGSASNGVDYGRLTGTAVIPAGASSAAVVIQALDDERAEATETVTLSLTSFNDTYSVSDQQHAASVALYDNADLPEITVRTVNNGIEGRSGASFVVHALGHTPGTVTVHYTVSGSARSGEDFTALQGTLDVPTDGSHDVVLPVSVLNDRRAEAAETVKITLSASSAYVLGSDKTAEAVIYDDDSGAERVAVSVFQDKPGETDSGTSTGRFYVYRTGTQGDLSVPVTFGGTASAGTDFTVAGLTNGQVLIPDGQKGAVVTFTVTNDRLGEGSENVMLTVGNGTGYSVDRSSSAAYWIADNDTARVTVGFKTIGTTIAEQSDPNGTVRDLKVVLSKASSTPISVALQPTEGTATGNNVDWAFIDPASNNVLEGSSTRITFAAGETEKTVRVRVNQDRVLEGAETATLSLVNPEGASLTNNRGLHTLHLYDNLAQRSSIVETRWAGTDAYDNNTWSAASKIYQGQLSNFSPLNGVGYAFSRQLVGEIIAPTSGEYTFWLAGDDRAKLYLSTDASAANKRLLTSVAWWDDYQSATVTLQAGQHYYLEAQQKDDGDGNLLAVEWEGPRFTRTAITAPGASEEDGGNRYIRLVGDGNVLHEDAGRDPHLWVTLDRPAGSAPVSVAVAVSGSARAGSDYTLGSTSLTFNPGEQSKAVDLSLLTDTRGEAIESLRVTLSNATGAILTGPTRYDLLLLDANAPALDSELGLVNSRQAKVGDVVTQVTATPVAGHRITKWEIVAGNAERAGNPTPAFSIDNTGHIKVANVAALPLNSAGMQLTVRATDNTGATNDVNVDVVVNGAAALTQRWNGNAAYDAQDWSAAPAYSGNLRGTVAVRDVGDEYSQRIVGTLRPTESGDYRFWIASDDSSRLYLGTEATADSKTLIASMNGWTQFQNWDDGGRSQLIHLEAGKLYYFEAQHQEGGGGDHVSVAWEGPGFARQVIPVSAFVAGLPLDVATPHRELAVSYKAEVVLSSIDAQIGTDTGTVARINSGGVTRDNTLTLTGQADAGSLVQVFDGARFLGNATLSGTSWRFTTPTLSDARHTLTAQIVDTSGNIALTNSVSATVRTSKTLDTSAKLMLSSSAIADAAAQSVGISADASHLLLGTRNASAFGYRDTRSDSGGAYSDLVWFDVAHGTHALATFGAAANSTRGYQVSGVGISADGRSVVMQTPWAGDFAAFSDGGSSNELMVYNSVSRSLSLITHQPGSSTRAANAGASDVLLSNDGRYVFFTASDASKLGNSSAFRDSATGSNDVFAYDMTNGTLKLISHALNSNSTSAGVAARVAGQSQDGKTLYFATDNAAAFGISGGKSTNIIAVDMNSGEFALVSAVGGSYLNRGLVASHDGRYVSYTLRLEKNDTSMGWSINQGGDVVVITDTQTGVTRMVNHSGIEQSNTMSYQAWGYDKAKGFTADGRTLVFENSYLNWFNAGFSAAGDNVRGLLAYDTDSGRLRLLTHTADSSNKVQGADTTYAGLSADGKWALFSATDASQFGNNGRAFTDSNTSATDLLAVEVASGEIRLLSGTNGVSIGSETRYVGLSADGNTAYFTAADSRGLKDASGVAFVDADTAGMDLVSVRLNVLDLATASDTGNSYDNRTSAHDLTITAALKPNSSAILMDGSTQVGRATANADGLASWALSNVSTGEHSYSLLDGTEQVPIRLVGSVAASVLEVTVI